MADVNRGARPLSPHLQVYRPQWTMVGSISHRITGVALTATSLMLVWWLIAAATGPEAFATADGFVTSWFGDIVLFLSVPAFWYHFFAGVRHLIWDTVHELEVPRARRLSYACWIAAGVMSLVTFILFIVI